MSENNEERANNSFDEILGEDIVNKIVKNMDVALTDKQIRELEKEAEGSTEFMKAIENIQIPTDNYVVFTDGDEQLLYENGEFFIISTKDTPLRRKKKTKKEATEMYLSYFIKYELNGLLGDKKDKETKGQEINDKAKDERKTKLEPKVVAGNVEQQVEVKEQIKEQSQQSIVKDMDDR